VSEVRPLHEARAALLRELNQVLEKLRRKEDGGLLRQVHVHVPRTRVGVAFPRVKDARRTRRSLRRCVGGAEVAGAGDAGDVGAVDQGVLSR
jgi:hypothetical protein